MRRSVRSLMIAVAVIAVGLGYWASTQSKEAQDRQLFIDYCKRRADYFQGWADYINKQYPIIDACFGPDHHVSQRVRNMAAYASRNADLFRRKSRLDFRGFLDAEYEVDGVSHGGPFHRFDLELQGWLREARGETGR